MSTPSYQTIKTPINGLKVYLNKVVGDDRGYFCDLAETDNPLFKNLVHLHASIATTRGVARGAHYHYRLTENFYALSGTSLWIFHDFNKKSKTYGKTWSLILGFSPETKVSGSDPDTLKKGTRSYFIDKDKLAQVEVSPYIYHAFWPLTRERVIAFVTGTTGYDATDFARLSIDEVPGAKKILEKHDIKSK